MKCDVGWLLVPASHSRSVSVTPSVQDGQMDLLEPFTFVIGALGTLATACTWLGLRRWAIRAVGTRELLVVAVVLWMPDVWTRWVQQTAEEQTKAILDYASTLHTPPTTTIPK